MHTKSGRGCPRGRAGRGYIPSETSLALPITDAAIDETKHCRAGIQNHHFINIPTKASDLFRSRAMIIMAIWKRRATRLARVNQPIHFGASGAGRAARRAGLSGAGEHGGTRARPRRGKAPPCRAPSPPHSSPAITRGAHGRGGALATAQSRRCRPHLGTSLLFLNGEPGTCRFSPGSKSLKIHCCRCLSCVYLHFY